MKLIKRNWSTNNKKYLKDVDSELVVGYKATQHDLTCRDIQFELGKKYTVAGKIKACKNGFHFCSDLEDIFSYYHPLDYEKPLRLFKVEGSVHVYRHGDKHVCKRIKFVEELSIEHLMDNHSHNVCVRIIAAQRGYRLDQLISDTRWEVRCEVAKQGYGLDVLVNDPNQDVRAAVANRGYRLDLLVADPSSYVRVAVANQGYGFDTLINDKNWSVRVVIAEQGYGLDTLVKDPDLLVRITAEQKIKELLHTNSEVPV